MPRTSSNFSVKILWLHHMLLVAVSPVNAPCGLSGSSSQSLSLSSAVKSWGEVESSTGVCGGELFTHVFPTSFNQFEQPRSSWAQTRSPSLMEDLADVTGLKARNKTEEVGCINFPRDWQLSPSCFYCGDIWYVYVYVYIYIYYIYYKSYIMYIYTSSTLQPPKPSTMAWFAA